MYILVQKEDHLIDKPILHQSSERSDRKKRRKFKFVSIGLQVSYQFVSIFPFCCLASLQELRIQVGGNHESFCVFWNLVFTPNKLSVYTEFKDWNTSKLKKTEYWNGVSCETRLPRVSKYFVPINFFSGVIDTMSFLLYIFGDYNKIPLTELLWAVLSKHRTIFQGPPKQIGHGMQPQDKT